MSRWRTVLPLLLLVLAGSVLFGSGILDRLHPDKLIAHQHELQAQAIQHTWLARLAFIGLLTLIVCTGIPGSVIVIIAGGIIFGTLQGTLYSSSGLTLGSLILFLASRYAFGNGSHQPPALVKKLHCGFERQPASYTFFLRFIPVAPFGLVTVCLAWLRCPLWLFLIATWLGGTVTLVFETLIGTGLGKALQHSDHLSLALLLQREVLLPVLGIAVLALLSLLLGRLTARRRAKAAVPSSE